jgi:hypothetical protein
MASKWTMENGLEYEMEYRYLLVKDHTREGTVHMKSAIVTNEAQFPEFIHEKIDSGGVGPIISANISWETLGRTF